MFTPRIAPAIVGMALLEAIDEDDMKRIAKEQAESGSGISGELNYVWDVLTKKKAVGKFGWKANQPTIVQQVAAAALGDMGITTFVFPDEECTDVQVDCLNSPSSSQPQLEALHYRILNNYVRTLAVPARRNIDDIAVIKGEKLFKKIGCVDCHRDDMVTSKDASFSESDKLVGKIYHFTEFTNQNISPYTDLLLHDMGEGLADNRPDFEASGRQWRTPPLWGIGLVETVNHHHYLLHDGRARGFAEAILWHGGEAETAKEKFRNLSKSDRDNLIKFLKSL